MSVSGEAGMLAKLSALELGIQKDARAAVRDGAEVFEDALRADTPEWTGETDAPTHMRDDVTKSNTRDRGGELEVDVGYGQVTGYRVHFPNSGTSKQSPQHFVEETQARTKDAVLVAIVAHLKVGG